MTEQIVTTSEGSTAASAAAAPQTSFPEPTAPQTARPGLSTAQLADARADWIRLGHDPNDFDAAARADGLDPTPADPKVSAHHAEFNLPEAPTPADYRVNYGAFAQTKTTERLGQINTELTEWAAELNLSSGLGTAVIERLVELGPRLQAMKPAARGIWLREQEAIALRQAGSEEKLAETWRLALAALDLAEESGFSHAVANSTALHDPWLLFTLANHARTVMDFTASHPK